MPSPELTIQSIDINSQSVLGQAAVDLVAYHLLGNGREHSTVYRCMTRPETYTYGLMLDESLIGVASLDRLYSAPYAELHYLVVHPDHRGKRIGRGFLERVEEREKRDGIPGITLISRRNSRRFYSYQGYCAEPEPNEWRYTKVFPEIIT